MAECRGGGGLVRPRMASCPVLLVQLLFVASAVGGTVKRLESGHARANAGLTNETTSDGGGRTYEIEIQFDPQRDKSLVQSARQLLKHLKKWRKSYRAEVEFGECLVGYLTEKLLRQSLGPCSKRDEHRESRDYLSGARFQKRVHDSGRLKQDSNLILDFDDGYLMHLSDGEETTGWAPHSGQGGGTLGWEEQQEMKHLLYLLREKITGCEFKKAVAQFLHQAYLQVTTFISKNVLLACVAKYLLKKLWKWVDLAP